VFNIIYLVKIIVFNYDIIDRLDHMLIDMIISFYFVVIYFMYIYLLIIVVFLYSRSPITYKITFFVND